VSADKILYVFTETDRHACLFFQAEPSLARCFLVSSGRPLFVKCIATPIEEQKQPERRKSMAVLL
jgi:hypothetical protein